MPTLPWTTDFMMLASIALLLTVTGSFAAFVGQSRYTRKLSEQIQHLTSAIHDKELIISRLQTQLHNAQTTEQRLGSERDQCKDEQAALSQTLDHLRQQVHTTEKQLASAQADHRALTQQTQELRSRLQSSEQAIQQQRDQASQLNEALAQEGKQAKALEAAYTQTREQLHQTQQALAEQQAVHSLLQQDHQSLRNEHTQLTTTLQRKQEHFSEQMQQLSDTKQALSKEFENLANKIFDEKGKTFAHTSQASIDTLLKPFREQITGFQKRINEVHDASIQGNAHLHAEINRVREIGLHIGQEASNLTSALKGDSQQRGAWGEAQLRRTLEISGLMPKAHYSAQTAFKDAQGKHRQTDYLINLPDGKHIIIDSKVALNAYDRALSASSPQAYQLAMEEHIKVVRKHMDDLAAKDYTNLVGMHSPSFVLMFMPIEPAYIEALKHSTDLFEYGYNKGIVLVSHTTLIPILRTVSNLWMIEHSNAEARKICEQAGDIYNQVCTVAERLSKLGNSLNSVSTHYNSTVTALAGQQGLYGKVDRFSQLSTKVSKRLPPLQPTHRDFTHEPLTLIAQPITDPQQQNEAE